jgi:hypothetical protein
VTSVLVRFDVRVLRIRGTEARRASEDAGSTYVLAEAQAKERKERNIS